jgi:DNA-binding FadR family transcriptional regulator
MSGRPDAEVAGEFKSEAAQLREKAQSHRKLAKLYRSRSPAKATRAMRASLGIATSSRSTTKMRQRKPRAWPRS